MPALINCHTHLYSTLARGISLAGRAPRNFREILKKLWWRLDRALNLDDVYYSALVGLIDSAKCGVGMVVDHHSSPKASNPARGRTSCRWITSPPTPLDGKNLVGHILFGIANAPVDSLLVNGRFVLRNKECVTVDERGIAEKASTRARLLWNRF
jgi:hypothetical protein